MSENSLPERPNKSRRERRQEAQPREPGEVGRPPEHATKATAATTTLEKVTIGDSEILCIRGEDGERYAVLRRMCDHVGVDHSSRVAKLMKAAWATMVNITTVAEDGKSRELLCLNIRGVPMWLAPHCRRPVIGLP